jgi:hypothetical protein
VNTAALWPKSTYRALYQWPALAGKLGCTWPLTRPFLLGIRGVGLGDDNSHETRSRAVYDDSFCLLPAGKPHALFRGSSHAYQLFSKQSPDVNRDGIGDVATINPGRYLLTWKMDDGAGCPVFELTMPVGAKDIPCARDLNHDGSAELGPYTANAVLFHSGYDAPPGAAHSSSIACQTTSVANLKLMKQAGHVIDYVLTTAEEAVRLVAELPPWEEPEGNA